MTGESLTSVASDREDTVLINDRENGIRLLTISRVARRNALDKRTYQALTNALIAADADESVRVVVLTGAGNVFTSGNDLADFRTATGGDAARAGINFLKVLCTFTKPLVAAVEGYAIGIGATLLLHCDFAYAGRGTQFRLPFTALGLCPEGGSSYLLPRIAGTKRAADLLMLGEAFTAEMAVDSGIITSITDDGGSLTLALGKAHVLAGLSPQALAVTKHLLKQSFAKDLEYILQLEAENFDALRQTSYAQAVFAAFFAN